MLTMVFYSSQTRTNGPQEPTKGDRERQNDRDRKFKYCHALNVKQEQAVHRSEKMHFGGVFFSPFKSFQTVLKVPNKNEIMIQRYHLYIRKDYQRETFYPSKCSKIFPCHTRRGAMKYYYYIFGRVTSESRLSRVSSGFKWSTKLNLDSDPCQVKALDPKSGFWFPLFQS